MPRPRTTAYAVFLYLREVKVARIRDIARATGLSTKRVYSALITLMSSGHVEKIGEGLYAIKTIVW